MKVTITVSGGPALIAKLARLNGQIPQVLGAVLYREAEGIMTVAKTRTPVDTNALRKSGTVFPPVTTATGAKVTLGFGGAAKAYAVYVHENMTARHPVGQAKFLESAVNDARNGMEARLGAALGREIDRVAGGR